MKLSIVIVNYNSSEDLGRCLASLEKFPPPFPHAIVVVDNASREPGLAAVRDAHPSVRWIVNKENTGYARGVNLGLAAEPADYALILNPDIEVLPGAIDALVRLADARPKAGIVAPQLLGRDGEVQHSARRFYTLNALLMRRTPLGRLFPESRSLREHLMLDFDHASERLVDWVLGGAQLVRREARERVGLLDERFFLYFEDVDWCYRMWQAGWEVVYTPAARFVHGHRRASARGALHPAFWLHVGSMISFYEKWGLLVFLLKRWRRPLVIALQWLLDMVALNGALAVAYVLRSALNPLFPERLFPLADYVPLFVFASLLASATFVVRGRYDRGQLRQAAEPASAAALSGLVSLLLLSATFLTHQRLYSRPLLILFIPLLWLALIVTGAFYLAVRSRMERGDPALERTLLVGPAATLAAWLATRGDLRRDGLDPVGYACDPSPGNPEPSPLRNGELPWLGGSGRMLELALRYRVSQLLFVGWRGADARTQGLLRELRHRHIRLRWLFEDDGLLLGARQESFGDASSLVLEPHDGSDIRQVVEGLADRFAGAFLLVVGALPYLVLRTLKPGATRRVPFRWIAAGAAAGPRLRLLPTTDGHPRRIWWQAPLGWDLLRGRVGQDSGDSVSRLTSATWTALIFATREFAPAAEGDVPTAESSAR